MELNKLAENSNNEFYKSVKTNNKKLGKLIKNKMKYHEDLNDRQNRIDIFDKKSSQVQK